MGAPRHESGGAQQVLGARDAHVQVAGHGHRVVDVPPCAGGRGPVLFTSSAGLRVQRVHRVPRGELERGVDVADGDVGGRREGGRVEHDRLPRTNRRRRGQRHGEPAGSADAADCDRSDEVTVHLAQLPPRREVGREAGVKGEDSARHRELSGAGALRRGRGGRRDRHGVGVVDRGRECAARRDGGGLHLHHRVVPRTLRNVVVPSQRDGVVARVGGRGAARRHSVDLPRREHGTSAEGDVAVVLVPRAGRGHGGRRQHVLEPGDLHPPVSDGDHVVFDVVAAVGHDPAVGRSVGAAGARSGQTVSRLGDDRLGVVDVGGADGQNVARGVALPSGGGRPVRATGGGASHAGEVVLHALEAHLGVADREHVVLRVALPGGPDVGLLEHVLGGDVARRAAFEHESVLRRVPGPIAGDGERVAVDHVGNGGDRQLRLGAPAREQREVVVGLVPGPACGELAERGVGHGAAAGGLELGARRVVRGGSLGRERGTGARRVVVGHDGVRFAGHEGVGGVGDFAELGDHRVYPDDGARGAERDVLVRGVPEPGPLRGRGRVNVECGVAVLDDGRVGGGLRDHAVDRDGRALGRHDVSRGVPRTLGSGAGGRHWVVLRDERGRARGRSLGGLNGGFQPRRAQRQRVGGGKPGEVPRGVLQLERDVVVGRGARRGVDAALEHLVESEGFRGAVREGDEVRPRGDASAGRLPRARGVVVGERGHGRDVLPRRHRVAGERPVGNKGAGRHGQHERPGGVAHDRARRTSLRDGGADGGGGACQRRGERDALGVGVERDCGAAVGQVGRVERARDAGNRRCGRHVQPLVLHEVDPVGGDRVLHAVDAGRDRARVVSARVFSLHGQHVPDQKPSVGGGRRAIVDFARHGGAPRVRFVGDGRAGGDVGHRGHRDRGVEVSAGQTQDVAHFVVGTPVGDGGQSDHAVHVEGGGPRGGPSAVVELERALRGREGGRLGHGETVALPRKQDVVPALCNAASLGDLAREDHRVERVAGLLVVLDLSGSLQRNLRDVDVFVELLRRGHELHSDRGLSDDRRRRDVPVGVRAVLRVEDFRRGQPVVQVAVGVVARANGSLRLKADQHKVEVVEVGRDHCAPRGARGLPVGVHALEHEVVAVRVHDAGVLGVGRAGGADNAGPPGVRRIHLGHGQRDELVGVRGAVGHGGRGDPHGGRPRQLEEWSGAVVRDQTVPEDAHVGDVLIEVTRGSGLCEQRGVEFVLHGARKGRGRGELGRHRVGHDEPGVDVGVGGSLEGDRGVASGTTRFGGGRGRGPGVGVAGAELGELGVGDAAVAVHGEHLELRKISGRAAVNVH